MMSPQTNSFDFNQSFPPSCLRARRPASLPAAPCFLVAPRFNRLHRFTLVLDPASARLITFLYFSDTATARSTSLPDSTPGHLARSNYANRERFHPSSHRQPACLMLVVPRRHHPG